MKTTLFNAINSASDVLVDNIEIDHVDDCGEPTLRLSMCDGGLDYEWTFEDQDVEINADGGCFAVDVEGDSRHFTFRVSHPMKAADLNQPPEE